METRSLVPNSSKTAVQSSEVNFLSRSEMIARGIPQDAFYFKKALIQSPAEKVSLPGIALTILENLSVTDINAL